MMTLEAGEKIKYGHSHSDYTYVIEGDPIPLARARHGRGKTWDTQKNEKYACGVQLQSQHTCKHFFSGPIHIDICFYLPLPRLSKKAQDGAYHLFRPDLSNLIKFIEDVGTGILYKDDCLISSLSATKKYSHNPRTEFTISELTPYE